MFHALYCFFDLWRERGMQGGRSVVCFQTVFKPLQIATWV